jgi:uncharacterized membrane protein YfcA
MVLCAAGALAASFPPWQSPPIAPPATPLSACDHERIGGWLGGALGGWIGTRMGRHHDDRDDGSAAATAFGAVFGYWLGAQIGRNMDQDNPHCPGAHPPRGTVSVPPLRPTLEI